MFHDTSHPTWVRGLKHSAVTDIIDMRQSHPTWVRGLKLPCRAILQVVKPVAPYVGAWIETGYWYLNHVTQAVSHPTWVRGLKRPFPASICTSVKSHPTWVRGLKHRLSVRLSLPSTSHPTWVRGLKHACAHDFCIRIRVAPYVGAWIETVKR